MCGPLAERLLALTLDRTLPAAELARACAARIQAWVFEQPLDWSWLEAREALEEGLRAWRADQGWRGPCARLVDVLEHAHELAADGHGPREVLCDELGLWDEEVDRAGEPWSGRALDPGRRLVDRGPVREHALLNASSGAARGLERGERVLVLTPGELIEPALEAAWKEGLEPRIVLGEGGPQRDGLCLARRLAEAGIEVELTYDAALVRQVDRVDRVWLGTEATDGRDFLAPAGAEAILVRARALDVPVELFATRDERLPAEAALTGPAWSERDRWLLWEHAPTAVQLLSEAHEVVSLDLVQRVVTERGRLSPARFEAETLWPVDAPFRRPAAAELR